MLQRILAICLFAAVCLGWLSSGPGATVLAAQGTPCAPDSNDTIAAIADHMNTAVDQHDIATIATLFSTDVSREYARGNGAGLDSTIASFEEIFTAFPDVRQTTNLVLVDTPLAMVHYTVTATQAAPFLGSEPSGKPVTWDGMYLIEVECGKIVRMWSEVDQRSLMGNSDSTPATPVTPAEAASPASCPELTREAARSLMDTWYHEVWTGNTDVLATLTTSDVYHHWAQGPDSSGQEAQLAHLQATLDMLPGLTSNYDQLIVSGDFIAVHWEQSLGDDTWSGMNIFRTNCGKIAEVWSEMNISELPDNVGAATPAA